MIVQGKILSIYGDFMLPEDSDVISPSNVVVVCPKCKLEMRRFRDELNSVKPARYLKCWRCGYRFVYYTDDDLAEKFTVVPIISW